MKRVKLPLLPGLEVEFTDRDRAVRQVEELAVRGTALPMVRPRGLRQVGTAQAGRRRA